MSSIEERLGEVIVHGTSKRDPMVLAGVSMFVIGGGFAIRGAPLLGGWAAFAGLLVALAGPVIAIVASTIHSQGVRFSHEGVELLERRGKSTFISYADISGVQRLSANDVVITTAGRIVRLGREGSREPYVSDVLAELVAYLEANAAEARALAEDREVVVAFLARGAHAGDDYRHAPAPRSALEAVARSRVMPARLRVDAARALGADSPEELEESSDANERRRV